MKKNKTPKYAAGALVGAGIGLASNIFGMIQAKKQQRKAIRNQQNMELNAQKEEDILELEEFPEEGHGIVNYQKKGGKLAIPASYNTKGGNLIPLSSDMEEVKGNKHGETKIDNTSGVKLMKGGKAFAEVEDEETIKDGQMVYSDMLKAKNGKTYAENAKAIAKEKGKLEKKVNMGDNISNNTTKRMLANLDTKENLLFLEQEKSKSMENTQPEKLEEGGFAKFAKDATPYIDNIGNALLTLATPKVNKPNLQRVKNLKTTVNVEPQLQAVNDAVDATSTFVQSNTSNSASARNSIAGTRLQGAKQKAEILGSKENMETQLINQNRLNKQQVTAQNLAKLDDYGTKNMMRLNDIQSRTSANLANLADDFIDKRNFDAQQQYNDEYLDAVKDTYQQDTTNRSILNNPHEIEKMRNDPVYREQQLKRFKGTPEESKLLDLLRMTKPASTLTMKPYAKID